MSTANRLFSETLGHNLNILKQEMVETATLLGNLGFHAAFAGNLSARVGEDLILCTRRGVDKRCLTFDDLLLCDLDGRKLEGIGEPTSELSMHRAVYRVRSDALAAIHSHPPTATGFAAASVPFDDLMLPEMFVLLGQVAMVPYATPGTEDLGRELERLLPDHDAFLLENHGAIAIGNSLRQAAMRMELIEQHARVSLVVRQLGKPFKLSELQREALEEIRRRVGSSFPARNPVT